MRWVAEVRPVLLAAGHSPVTDPTHVRWMRQYIPCRGARRRVTLGRADMKGSVEHLAMGPLAVLVNWKQALNVLVLALPEVPGMNFGAVRRSLAPKPRIVPVVLTGEEAQAVNAALHGSCGFMGLTSRSGGLLLAEYFGLRVRDAELKATRSRTRNVSGEVGRATLAPEADGRRLDVQAEGSRLHWNDLADTARTAPFPGHHTSGVDLGPGAPPNPLERVALRRLQVRFLDVKAHRRLALRAAARHRRAS